MKRFLFFIISLLSLVAAKGQSSYDEAIKQGDNAYDKQQYKIAINLYFAAEAFDRTKKDVVRERVNKVFDAIQALRKKAEDDRARAQAAAVLAKKALQARDSAKAEKKLVTNALKEAKKAKDDEHNALVRSITQLENIETVQDSLKKEILALLDVDTAVKQRLIAILQTSAQGFHMASSPDDQKIISEYIISNEGPKFHTAHSIGPHKYIGVGFPLDASFSRAKIEAMGVSYDDVLAGTRALTDGQVDILFESDLDPFIRQTNAVFTNFHSIGPNRQAALIDLAYYSGTTVFRRLDVIQAVDAGDWADVESKIKKYADARYSNLPLVKRRYYRDADMLLTGKLPKK